MRRCRFNVGLGLIFLLMLTSTVWAQGVRVVVVNEFANIRLSPALGATVMDTVSAGFEFNIVTARSGDNQWLRVDYGGAEGWVNIAPLIVLQGDINSLPIADPRSIPYGGFEAPRSGSTTKTGNVAAKATDGVRIRSGPSTAYPTLANINFNQLMTLTGRTASGLWYQVSFEGTLGWVNSTFVAILSGDFTQLPIDGIIADKPPVLGITDEDYFGVLRLMRDRINLAQPSLDTIRAAWADAALTGRAQCNPYPARPSDMSIPVPLMAAFYDVLNPLLNDFNVAMFNVRKAIDLFIEVCNQPGTANPVGQATVIGALETVNLAQTQFDSLRNRLNGLLPPDSGEGQCLLIYNGRSELLPLINISTIYLDEFNRRNYATGYCFDGVANQAIAVQALPLPDANISLFMSVSPLDAPASFLGVARAAQGQRVALGPITLPRTTRYVVILADIAAQDRPEPPQGDFAVLISDVSVSVLTPVLQYDEATGSVIIGTDAGSVVQTTPQPGTQGGTATGAVPSVCPSTAFNCNQLFTCDEARACLAAGNFSLDADNDSVPCEEVLCAGQGTGQ